MSYSDVLTTRQNMAEDTDTVSQDDAHRSEARPPSSGDRPNVVDERAPLLAGQQQAQDAPLPSPYNLAVVRYLRNLTLFSLFLTLLWFILLFIGVFVSIPGFKTRASGFTDVV